MLYECMKFCRNISYCFQVIEQTQFFDGQTDGRKGKNNMSPDPSRGETIHPLWKVLDLNLLHKNFNIVASLCS